MSGEVNNYSCPPVVKSIILRFISAVFGITQQVNLCEVIQQYVPNASLISEQWIIMSWLNKVFCVCDRKKGLILHWFCFHHFRLLQKCISQLSCTEQWSRLTQWCKGHFIFSLTKWTLITFRFCFTLCEVLSWFLYSVILPVSVPIQESSEGWLPKILLYL